MSRIRIIATSPIFSIDVIVDEKKAESRLKKIKKQWVDILKKVEKPLVFPNERLGDPFVTLERGGATRERIIDWKQNNRLSVTTEIID
jgi:hypothetical protein